MWHSPTRLKWVIKHEDVEPLGCCLLIGNSRWHWAKWDGLRWRFDHSQPDCARIPQVGLVWAAVGSIPPLPFLNPERRLSLEQVPILDLPNWIGIDRALAAWGAIRRAAIEDLPQTGLIVADAGTVFSLTCINRGGAFTGGQLLPGAKLQLQAMASGAVMLPEVELIRLDELELFPKTTAAAMQRGCLQALTEVISAAAREGYPLWLCGGDASMLISELKNRVLSIRYQPDLVLQGMSSVADYLNLG